MHFILSFEEIEELTKGGCFWIQESVVYGRLHIVCGVSVALQIFKQYNIC